MYRGPYGLSFLRVAGLRVWAVRSWVSSFAAEGDEGFALEVEDVLFAENCAKRARPRRECCEYCGHVAS